MRLWGWDLKDEINDVRIVVIRSHSLLFESRVIRREVIRSHSTLGSQTFGKKNILI